MVICLFSVSEWVQSKKYSSFGLSSLHGSGSHDIKGLKHRFVVMERYGQDLWTIFLEHKRRFPLPVVLRVAIQVVSSYFLVVNAELVYLNQESVPLKKLNSWILGYFFTA